MILKSTRINFWLLAIPAIFSTILAAQSAPAKSKKEAPAVAATRPVAAAPAVKRHPDGRPSGVPYDAVKIASATWRIVENGKPIIYRQTAFGYSKLSEEENAKVQRMIDGKPDESAEIPAGITVAEKDGKLHYSRVTPFGPYHWVKGKNELNAVEKAVWERSQRGTSAAKPEVRN